MQVTFVGEAITLYIINSQTNVNATFDIDGSAHPGVYVGTATVLTYNVSAYTISNLTPTFHALMTTLWSWDDASTTSSSNASSFIFDYAVVSNSTSVSSPGSSAASSTTTSSSSVSTSLSTSLTATSSVIITSAASSSSSLATIPSEPASSIPISSPSGSGATESSITFLPPPSLSIPSLTAIPSPTGDVSTSVSSKSHAPIGPIIGGIAVVVIVLVGLVTFMIRSVRRKRSRRRSLIDFDLEFKPMLSPGNTPAPGSFGTISYDHISIPPNLRIANRQIPTPMLYHATPTENTHFSANSTSSRELNRSSYPYTVSTLAAQHGSQYRPHAQLARKYLPYAHRSTSSQVSAPSVSEKSPHPGSAIGSTSVTAPSDLLDPDQREEGQLTDEQIDFIRGLRSASVSEADIAHVVASMRLMNRSTPMAASVSRPMTMSAPPSYDAAR
ncbi:hypothetical protein HWV62_4373 [Athelia sp. TMB]|nr:hypothetical protein HWV62_4373 [Athelia sp. TMB]